MKNVLLITIGCAKNQVDSETVLSFFERNGFNIVLNPYKADVIVINTCGFILPAKQESIDTILKYSKYGKKLVVIGCLVERYFNDLKSEMPEVDLFIPIRDYPRMLNLINGLFNDELNIEYHPYKRVISTGNFSSYLKISDGCSNHCAYCAIPLIRGEFHSIPKEVLIQEAKRLISIGIKELVIISQDTSKYGSDLYNDYDIVNLLEDILNLNGFVSIRLLYLYAFEVSDRLIDLISKNSEVLQPYFDIPIQHASDKMLKLMNRKDKKTDIISLYNRIKNKIPNAILRTTLIVGFPNENNEDFNELLDFITQYKFDHLGAFKYSKEEGTAGFLMDNQIDEEIKELRLNKLMKLQSSVSYIQNKTHINEIMNGIIIGESMNGDYLVRTYFNAPDDIDGNIYLKHCKTPLKLGDEVKIKIINCGIYDLEAELID